MCLKSQSKEATDLGFSPKECFKAVVLIRDGERGWGYEVKGQFYPPKRHLAKSGNIFGWHRWVGEGCY